MQPPTTHSNNEPRSPDNLQRAIANAIESARRYEDIVETHVKYHGTDRDLWVAGLDDHRFKRHCEQLMKLYAALTKDDGEPCIDSRAQFRSSNLSLPAVKLKPLGKRIVASCQVYAANEHWGAAWANHVFHPIVTVLLRSMKRYAVRISQCQISDNGVSHDLELGSLMRRLAHFVRRVSRSWKYINAVNGYTTKEEDNFDSARDFIYYLAGQHTRLCFLRIDLTFRTSSRDFSHTEAADKAVKEFIRSLRSKACKRNLLPGYLGFFIKRENGISRGTHFHLMIVLNGNLQGKTDHSVAYLSDALGRMWLHRIGHDRGSFHNSYKDRTNWPFNGLGLQDFQQLESLVGLRYALHYLTKQDCVLKTSNDKVKNFWRTPTPRGKSKKRGPLRKRSDHLSLLYRMLSGRRSPYPAGFDPTPYLLAHKRKQAAPKPIYGAWDTASMATGDLPE